jgi:LPXTG-motif cell wall-anchored protein
LSKTFRRSFAVGVSALVMLGLATAATPAYAASSVAVDLPNSPVVAGVTVDVPIAISGFTATEVTVSLLVEAGELTVDDLDDVLVTNPGFSSLENEREISFNGVLEDVTAVLADSVSWTAPAGEPSDLAMRVQIGEFEAGISYNPASGKSYRFVEIEDGVTWAAAQIAAKDLTYKNKPGYLTNITSEAENDFVADRSGARDVWIGATSNLDFVNAARAAATPPLTPPFTVDPKITGDYYWGAGPETGAAISTGLSAVGKRPVAVGGSFTSWAPGEPNNYQYDPTKSSTTGEDCAVTNWSANAALGLWNDLPCDNLNSYLVEFDTTAADFANSFVTFDNITGDSVDAVPAAVIVPELAATGTSSVGVFGGLAAALALLVGGGLLVATRRRNALSAE